MKKSFLFLLSAVAFIILIVFLASFGKSQPAGVNLSAFIPKPSPTPTPSPWFAYNNSHYGYSLNYPRGWEKTEWEFHEATQLNINRGPQEGMIWQQVKFEGKERSFQVVLWANRQKVAAPQWLRWYRHEDLDLKKIPPKSNYQILEKEAFLIFHEKPSWGYPAVHIFFAHEDKIFELIAQSPTENLEKIYQEMIESFQLTEGQ